jgi:putative membrane protein
MEAAMGLPPETGKPVPDLALIRTDLANERTVLAYVRTALMLVGTGVSLVKFLNVSNDVVLMGWTLIAAGAILGIVGAARFTSLKRRLGGVRRE